MMTGKTWRFHDESLPSTVSEDQHRHDQRDCGSRLLSRIDVVTGNEMTDARREPVSCTCKANGEHCYLCLYGEDAAAELRALADRLAASEEKAEAAQAWVNYTRKERDELKQRLAEVEREREAFKSLAECNAKRIEERDKRLTSAQATIARLEAEKHTFKCAAEASLKKRLQAEQQVRRLEALCQAHDKWQLDHQMDMTVSSERIDKLVQAEQQVARLREAVVALLKTTERWIAGRFAGDTDDFNAARKQAEQALRETGA